MKKKGKVPKMKNPPPPPKPPLGRCINETTGVGFCVICGSTLSRSGFLHLFGEILCDNDECPNSKTIFK